MHNVEIEPGERIDLLRIDLTATNIWLNHQYPSEIFRLMVDYYHHQKLTKAIAYVVILGPAQTKRRAIRAMATRALEALGWRVESEGGGDVLDVQPHHTKYLSAHERLRAIARVQNALDQEKQRN